MARVLSPVVGNTDNTVKNSQHFGEFIRGQTLEADQMLVSDVVSLFTKIPVDLAIKVATNKLRYDDSSWQGTSLPLEDITDLLSFCLNTTQFVFEGTYYKQVFGTAMGNSPECDSAVKGFAIVPYIQGIVEPIRRVPNNYGIKVALKPF